MAGTGSIYVRVEQGKNAGTYAEFQVEERVFTDPSAGQWTPGWLVFNERLGQEYFVDDGGDVWETANEDDSRGGPRVGVAPVIRAASLRMEALMEEAGRHA